METDDQAGRARGKGSLLVADDDDVSRALLGRALRRAGYEVALAANGAEALERLASEEVDLLLLDVEMPGMSGLEVLAHVRRRFSVAELPVVMVTARDSSQDTVEALRRGANDYVTKPLDLAVVLARVETQLSLRRATVEVRQLNRRLERAQERIEELLDSSPQAVEDLAAWAARAAREVAAAIGAESIALWAKEGEALRALGATAAPEPSVAELRRLSRGTTTLQRPTDVLFPVRGLAGELFGALAVLGGRRVAPGGVEHRLVASLARQLGGALEHQRMRAELIDAERRRQATRQELLDRGVDLLRVCRKCGRCYQHETERCVEDGARLDEPLAFPFRVAGRYELHRLLGEGGMGTVYEARDPKLGRTVALKVIKPEHCDDATVRLRFEREARAVARIAHPGVVEVHDVGELPDGSLYILMEHLRGRDLAEVINVHGRGTPRQVGQLLRQGGAALGAAHRAGLVHRDIKPGNIFLLPGLEARRFRVKILDFGVAKELTSDVGLTVTGGLVGTPLFMSPEQAQAMPIDLRSDIYSFAAVAYLALTGQRVTTKSSIVPLLMDVVYTTPPPVSAHRAGVPEAVDQAFAWALEKDPEARPPRIEAWVDSFVDALEVMAEDGPGWLLEAATETEEAPWEGSVATAETVARDGPEDSADTGGEEEM